MPQFGSLLAIVFAPLLCAGSSCAEPLNIVKDLRGRGLDVGGGLSVHLDNVDAPPNASIFERHALRLDYNGVGVRFRVDGEDDAYKVGLYYGEGREEKKKEVSELIIPALLGYKTSALVILSLFGIGTVVIKTLIVAKIALAVAAAFWAKKFFGGGDVGGVAGHHDMGQYSSDLHPVYAEYPGDFAELEYDPTASANYLAYAAPQQDVTGDVQEATAVTASASSQQYSIAEAPASVANALGAAGAANTTSQRRRESMISKPQAIHTFITVKKKSVAHGR